MATPRKAPAKKAGGRTTTPKPKAPRAVTMGLVAADESNRDSTIRVIDFDAAFAAKTKDQPVKRFRAFGQDWKLSSGPNVLEMMEQVAADPNVETNTLEVILEYIAPEDRKEFKIALLAQGYGWPQVQFLAEQLVEATSDFPT